MILNHLFWFFSLSCADSWWLLEISLPFFSSNHTHTRTHILTFLTRILPEEAFGAPKILPGQRGVPFKIIYEHFIQSLGPVDSVYDVRIWGPPRENHALNSDNQPPPPTPLETQWLWIHAPLPSSCPMSLSLCSKLRIMESLLKPNKSASDAPRGDTLRNTTGSG